MRNGMCCSRARCWNQWHGQTSTPSGVRGLSCAHTRELTRFVLTFLWLRPGIFDVGLGLLTVLALGPYRSTALRSVSRFRDPASGTQDRGATHEWPTQHSVFCSLQSQLWRMKQRITHVSLFMSSMTSPCLLCFQSWKRSRHIEVRCE